MLTILDAVYINTVLCVDLHICLEPLLIIYSILWFRLSAGQNENINSICTHSHSVLVLISESELCGRMPFEIRNNWNIQFKRQIQQTFSNSLEVTK